MRSWESLKLTFKDISNSILDQWGSIIILNWDHQWSDYIHSTPTESHPMKKRGILVFFQKPSNNRLLFPTLILNESQMIKLHNEFPFLRHKGLKLPSLGLFNKVVNADSQSFLLLTKKKYL